MTVLHMKRLTIAILPAALLLSTPSLAAAEPHDAPPRPTATQVQCMEAKGFTRPEGRGGVRPSREQHQAMENAARECGIERRTGGTHERKGAGRGPGHESRRGHDPQRDHGRTSVKRG